MSVWLPVGVCMYQGGGVHTCVCACAYRCAQGGGWSVKPPVPGWGMEKASPLTCICSHGSSPSRFLKNKIWPVIPSPERSFDELFSVYKGNFQARSIPQALQGSCEGGAG